MSEPTMIVRGREAVLIAAAAPELLEALERLVANLSEGEFTSLTRFDAARAAIAKARGQ